MLRKERRPTSSSISSRAAIQAIQHQKNANLRYRPAHPGSPPRLRHRAHRRNPKHESRRHRQQPGHIRSHANNVNFRTVVVGNEVSPIRPETAQYVPFLLNAMRNIRAAKLGSPRRWRPRWWTPAPTTRRAEAIFDPS